MRKLTGAVLMLGVIAVAGVSRAETVVLKNGDRISGDITKIWDDEVYIEPEYTDEFAIELDAVASIEADDQYDIELDDDSVLVGTVSTTDGQTVVNTAEGTRPLDLFAIREMEEPDPHFDWLLQTDLAADISKGNSDAESFHWYLMGFTQFGNHKHTGEVAMDRQEADGITSKEEDKFRYTYDWSFSRDWSLYGIAGWQRDPIRDLDRRMTLGGGLGYEIWDSGRRHWHVGLGADYIDEEIGGVSEESMAAHWLLRFRHDVFGGDASLFHDHDIISYVSGRNNLIFETRTGISYELTDDIDASLQVNYDWESDPAPGFGHYDLQYLIGIALEFD